MFLRLKRTGLSLVILVAAYWTYSLAAVPWIEPDVVTTVGSAGEPVAGGEAANFAHLFPPGSWELERPKVLETDQGVLLFDDYKQDEAGALRLTRCTLISFLSDGADGQDRTEPERPLVVQSSDGAVLEFDSPLNLARGQFGRFVRGRLLGDVTIFSPPSADGAEDALVAKTRNVQIEPQRIWAPGNVEFRYGPNEVAGRDLSVHLSAPDNGAASEKVQVGKIQSLELVHVDRVDLLFDAGSLDDSPGMTPRRSADATAAAGTGPTPVEVHCDGPFRFNFEQMVASLEERVDVIRHHRDGASDQLNCELLEIHFERAAAPAAEADANGAASANGAAPEGGSKLRPIRIVAIGFPAIIRAPSMQAGARGARFEYDLVTRRVSLHDDKQTVLFNEAYQVRAPHLEYELREDGGLGRLRATGPGRIDGSLGEQQRKFDAQWQGEVTLLPQGPDHVLSVASGARVAVAESGALRANEIHVYLRELPAGRDGKREIIADRLLARGDVHADSPRLVADLQEARLWFRQSAGAANSDRRLAPRTPQATGPLGPALAGPGRAGEPTTTPPARLRLDARTLLGQVILGDEPTLEALNVEGDVRLTEIQPSATSSIDLAAQQLILENGASTNPTITFQGRPARIEARGLALVGDQITIEQGNNRARIDGPGSMTISPRHLASGPRMSSGAPQPLVVDWQRAMQFDGRTARFESDVESRGGFVNQQSETMQFVARGDVLQVALNQKIDFGQQRAPADLDAEQVTFLGPVEVHSRTVNPLGVVTATDDLFIRDLTFHRPSGRLEGHGPGGRIVHRGPRPAAASPTARRAADGASPATTFADAGAASRAAPGLIYLQVDFEGMMLGNANQREVEFLDRTRTIYGPLASWNQTLDPTRPDLLRDEDVIVTSRRLAVADMGAAVGRERSLEIEATGNAEVRGRLFTATGERLSYVRSKDQLILEGDGRTDSTLEFRRQPAAPGQRLAAAKILFYPQSQQFALQDFQSLNLSDLGSLMSPQAAPNR